MNVDQLRKELAEDEGCKYEIYLDHLGYPTFGIGHLITQKDPEYKLLSLDTYVGIKVSETRVNEVFESDIEQVLKDCTRLYDDFYLLPEEVQLIIANMMFNLGYPRLEKFKDMYFNISTRNWQGAADEMVNSKWYRQVTNRAERLVQRMRQVDA
jgi:lysozyme|tara:strand:+ start:1753 stop:2214 length:462 start_codon:yes stop_codon:yes gene_type:complete